MKISRKDAVAWFSLFAQMDGETELSVRQTEIAYAVLAQIERAVEKKQSDSMRLIPGLKTLKSRTLYVGKDEQFPGGCRSCLMGTGLTAVRKTNRCNLQCPFCYNFGELDCQEPIGEGLWEIGGGRYRADDLELLMEIQGKPSGVSYVYLEPFMEIELYPEVIRIFHKNGVYQHMYTNGTLCTRENLKALADAGLDELRFNLGATDCSDAVIRNMAAACEVIPRVGIETPMTPDFQRQFLEKREAIFSTGISFMNCAELHLNPNNVWNYEGEPMYMSRLGYVSPAWSRLITLDLMAQAGGENWPILLHDCSNRTKISRDMNWKHHEEARFGATSYGREFERIPYGLFLPILEDQAFPFLEEEELPAGYRPGELAL